MIKSSLPYYRRIHWRDVGLTRSLNQQHVFIALREGKALSISDISRLTGLSISTIKTVVQDLIDMDLVIEVGEGHSTGGRRPKIFDLNLKSNFAIGAEIKRDTVSIGLCRSDGEIVAKYSTRIEGRDFQAVTAAITRQISEIFKEHELSVSDVIGIGVSQPAFHGGTDAHAPPGVASFGSASSTEYHLSTAVPFPTFFLDDTNAHMIAEADHGFVKTTENALYIQIGRENGRDIRGSLLCHNLLVLGAHGFSGEIGHIVIDPQGPVCYCGQRGCWKAMGEFRSFLDDIDNMYDEQVDDLAIEISRLRDSLLAGDTRINARFDAFVDVQSQGITALIHVFNPEIIVIGGDIAGLGMPFLNSLGQKINNSAMQPFLKNTAIELSRLSEDGAILGAAAFVLQHTIDIKRGIGRRTGG